MGYDENLADRIREQVAPHPAMSERKMFGGLAFLIGGHMAIAASGQGGVMVRVDPEQTRTLIDTTAAEPMVMRGSQSRGWVRVAAANLKTAESLAEWVDIGVTYAKSLPPKR